MTDNNDHISYTDMEEAKRRLRDGTRGEIGAGDGIIINFLPQKEMQPERRLIPAAFNILKAAGIDEPQGGAAEGIYLFFLSNTEAKKLDSFLSCKIGINQPNEKK